MLDASWSWLTDPANRDVIAWICGGFVVIIGGVWGVVKFFAKNAPSVRADRGGVAAGGSITNSSINTGERDALPGDPNVDPPKPKPPKGRPF